MWVRPHRPPPALALAGLVGTVFLGAMGLTQKVLIFACLPLGVWGVVRLLRPFGSQRASLVAGLSYLAMALAYNALALGRWGALVVYAGAPWVLARLFRATRSAPYGAGGDPAPGPGARGTTVRDVVALGLLEAVLVSFVPAAAFVVLVAARALLLSSSLFGEWRATGRAVGLALGSTLVAGVICLPWLIGVLAAGRGAVVVFGVPTPASGAASWASLLRFAVGPIGASPLAWGFAVAALVPLLLARGERFRWAGRCWSIALVFWTVAWLVGRGWTGSLAIDPLVLLAPAAVAVAASIGLGIAAFEEDLRAADFGWRQLITVVATGAVVLGSVPTLLSALPGRWDLPLNDFSQSVKWMGAKTAGGAFRVLWLGDPRSLNQGSWSAGGGLAYATSEDGSPDARWLWNAAGPGSRLDAGLGRQPGPVGSHRSARQLAGSCRGALRGAVDLAGPRDHRRTEPTAVSGPGRPGPGPRPSARPHAGGVRHRDHRLRQRRLDPRAGPDGRPAGRRRAEGPTVGRHGPGPPPARPSSGMHGRCFPGPPRPPPTGARSPWAPCSPRRPRSTAGPSPKRAGRPRRALDLVRLGREIPGDRGRGEHPGLRRRSEHPAVAAVFDHRLAGGDRRRGRTWPRGILAPGPHRPPPVAAGRR